MPKKTKVVDPEVINLTIDDINNAKLPEIQEQAVSSAALREQLLTCPEFKHYVEVMTNFDNEHFVAYQGEGRVFKEEKDIRGYHHLKPFKFKNFEDTYRGITVAVPQYILKGTKQCVTRKVSLAKEWLDHENKRRYNGIVFFPAEVLPKSYGENLYNEWKGFYVEGQEGEFPKLEYHLRTVWCQDNEEHYRYLMVWFADLIQRSERKSGVALVVKGNKGTGKSIIFENILEKILGSAYIKIDKAEQVTGKFNQHQYGKLLLVLEEAIWAGDKTAEGALKSMITDRYTTYEAKGVNAVSGESFIRLAFISNEKQAVPATVDERRFFAIRSSDEKQGDKQYFRELVEEIENGGREAFMHYISNLKYTDDEVRTPPRTNVLFEDIEEKMNTFERWIYSDLLQKNAITDGLSDLHYIWGDNIKINMLHYDYKNFLQYNKNKYIGVDPITSVKKFTTEFKDFFNIEDTQKYRIKGDYCFLNLNKKRFREIFEQKYKVTINWDDDSYVFEPDPLDELEIFPMQYADPPKSPKAKPVTEVTAEEKWLPEEIQFF